jgi:transcription antitermination factor NusG
MGTVSVTERAELRIRSHIWDNERGEWYAIHSRSNFEKRIVRELERKGVHAYLPAYEEIHQWKDRKKRVDLPLFPGYVFAHFTDGPATRLHILQTAGVVRILGHGSGIEPVPESQIDAVRTILRSGAAYSVHPLLRKGVRVRVVRGTLCGLEGVLARIKKQSRLIVSIPLLNQSVATEVNASDVEPVGHGQDICIPI